MWRKQRIGERISNGRSIAGRLGRDQKKKLSARSVAESFDQDRLKKTNVEQDWQLKVFVRLERTRRRFQSWERRIFDFEAKNKRKNEENERMSIFE